MSPGRTNSKAGGHSASATMPDMGLLVRFGERNGVTWHQNAETGQPERSIAPAGLRKEVETCGLCHARRGQFSEDWIPGQWLSDTHAVALLGRGLYSADGQMLDEVYNYGSFKQSKMFAAGVTCSDCHDPHSAKLRLSGDAVCLQCHAPAKYANASHTHHERRKPADRLRLMPHAGADLHGGRHATRSQLPHSASGSVDEA